MKRIKKVRTVALVPRIIVATIALAWGTGANAVELDTGNPGLKMRWDNTVRYNLGVRTEAQDPRLLASASFDEGDSKFGKHDVVTNRLDLLSEFELNYKNQVGVRASGSAWYDAAYNNHTVHSTSGVATSYFNNTYNNTVKRYMNGPSGELLDAFVWTNFKLGEAPVNIKFGRHALSWGEGVLIGGHAISYSQAPVDGVKALSSPGIETKELFLPLNQVSFKAQVTDKVSVFGQYFLDWKPTRVPMSGTYLMGADTTPTADRLGTSATGGFNNVAAPTPKKRGNWGVGTRIDVDAIDTKVGLYYRKFDDYAPETGIQLTPAAGTFRFVYAQDVELIGLSLAKQIGPVIYGSDLSLRKNGHLNSAASMSGDDGARGNTMHLVVNGTYGLPKTALWDTGVFIAEFAANHLDSITKNASLYRGEGYAACTETTAIPLLTPNACSTRNFYQAAFNFAPSYFAVFPGWDFGLPMSLNWGLKGKAASGGGGFQDLKSASIGLTATYQSKYEFGLRYADSWVPTRYNAAGTSVTGGGALSSAVGATDRGWLVFTFKTAL
jgi:hypothetical protein